jgi:HD-GYP domain-containing protein (c-di-GMP phosphodiesterase class II)
MQSQYPENVVDKILQVTLETNRFAYFSIDGHGLLLNKGGELSSMGMPDWEVGTNILEEALFLSGYIPMSCEHEYIAAYEVSASIVVDVHLFKDNGCCWVILVDKSAQKEWETTARQRTNELRLLQQRIGDGANVTRLDATRQKTHFDFFESLNMMALRAMDDGSFELLEPVSKRFDGIYPEYLEARGELHPQEKFAFIENFLVDAERAWKASDNSKRVRSGPWIETSTDGSEVALEATALNWEGNKLLFIEILDEHYQLHHDFLQIGREGVLLNNLLEEEVRKQTAEIRAREEEIALRLVCAADSRDDGETGSHIRRLGLYSELMARHLGWSEAESEEIRIAAPMHDIGKIGIPDHILKKPGKLTESEFEIMKLHPEIGGRILSNSSSTLVQMALQICLGHHEKWDGSGYPSGLSGKEIPTSARIVAIVDVFDALIHKRVYKNQMPIDNAIEIMLEGRGKHFDPQLLDLFISLKKEMTKIAFDYSNPIGEDSIISPTIIDDIHLIRPSN